MHCIWVASWAGSSPSSDPTTCLLVIGSSVSPLVVEPLILLVSVLEGLCLEGLMPIRLIPSADPSLATGIGIGSGGLGFHLRRLWEGTEHALC